MSSPRFSSVARAQTSCFVLLSSELEEATQFMHKVNRRVLHSTLTLADHVPAQVVKKIWEYIKAHDLQDPKNKRKIIVDDTLGKFLSRPCTMFTMNKQLSKHVYTRGNLPYYACRCTYAPSTMSL